MKSVSLALVISVVVACHKSPAAPPAAPAPANTAVAPAEPAKPTAESILEDAITATGGRAARAGVTSMHATGTMRIAKLGIGGTIEMMMKAPNLSRVVVDIDGIGRTESGSDGTTVWEKNVMTGARILAGDERERALRNYMLHSELAWRELYTKVELVGEVEFEGRPAWKIQMTTPLGDLETAYYDRETKLPLGKEDTSKTQMGDIPSRSVYEDYKTFGKLLMSTRLRQSAQGMDMEITLDTVELDPKLTADAFAVPADVAALDKE